jgi:uncharacterized protein (DUF4213/DUF364 family)
MLIDELCDRLLPMAGCRLAADVRIGLGYTAVQLDDGRCGLAYTFRHGTKPGCCVLREAGALCGRSAAELARGAHSQDLITAAVGLATLNALLPLSSQTSAGDVLDLMSIGPTDVVGMVGYFGPLVAPLKKTSRTLHIFEQRDDAAPEALPESAAKQLLPQCQVVIVSATALLNRTPDGVLADCVRARDIVILGPSTPLLPELFARRGVTILSGAEVIDSQQVLQVVSEGGGTRQFGKAIRKVSLRVETIRSDDGQS